MPCPLLILSVISWKLVSEASSLARFDFRLFTLSLKSPCCWFEPTTWPMVFRMSRASRVASRVFCRMATMSPLSLEESSARSPEKRWKLARVASSFAPLWLMMRSIPSLMRNSRDTSVRMLSSPSVPPRTFRRLPVMSEMSPAILFSDWNTSFIEGWRMTMRISSPSCSWGWSGVPGPTSRRKSPRMDSLRLVMVALRWRTNWRRTRSQTFALESCWSSSTRSTWPMGMPAIWTRERTPRPVASSNTA